jgi:4-hydroxybenzoate polyprenyltransferase
MFTVIALFLIGLLGQILGGLIILGIVYVICIIILNIIAHIRDKKKTKE